MVPRMVPQAEKKKKEERKKTGTKKQKKQEQVGLFSLLNLRKETKDIQLNLGHNVLWSHNTFLRDKSKRKRLYSKDLACFKDLGVSITPLTIHYWIPSDWDRQICQDYVYVERHHEQENNNKHGNTKNKPQPCRCGVLQSIKVWALNHASHILIPHSSPYLLCDFEQFT